MFLSGMIGRVPVLGLPACGMYHKITVFDLVLPRILTGQKIGRKEFAELGHGGLAGIVRSANILSVILANEPAAL